MHASCRRRREWRAIRPDTGRLVVRNTFFATLAGTLLMPSAFGAEPGVEQSSVGTMTVHDFAAKWMMQHDDIADVAVYAEANARLLAAGGARPRIVLMGDSLTYHWAEDALPALPDVQFVNRGIAGQNSSQMLLRFEDDVIGLAPAAVVILAGTNDLRVYAGDPGAAGPAILARIRRNVTAMTDIAAAHRVKVIVGALPPILPRLEGHRRDPQVLAAANAWLREFARQRGYAHADFNSVLADERGYLREPLTTDGLHLDPSAYRLLRPVLAAALREAGLAR